MQHNAFTQLSSHPIESLNVTVEAYQHKKTHALHYHIHADNDENVFLVAFRTVPQDDTGVAHILEHTVLCGSKKYPVRDPFFMMTRRSLNTFMNAFTSSDWTAYPFASQNSKDFNNLLDVYLDAVFYSRLHPLDFAQEGHRLEFAEPGNAQSPLVYKGVVFNEMKGALSSPSSIVWQTLSRYLFPTTTYHFNSGGDPEHIVQLSYEQLMEFYHSHYHPSNAVFMTYGNISAYQHQCHFQDKALEQFEQSEHSVAIHVNNEKRFYAPIRIQEHYPIGPSDPTEKATHHVMGWLLGLNTDLESMFKAQLLSSLLLDNSSSPLLHALESTHLGSSPSPLCGLEDSQREMSFMCGIEGGEADCVEEFEALVLGILEKIANEGLPLEQVKSILHQLEITQREIGGGSYPYGLQLMLAGLPGAIHGADVASILNLDPVLNRLHQEIEDENFVKRLVKELLLDNPHRVTLTLKPDPSILERQKIAEHSRLDQLKTQLSTQQVDQLIKQSQELLERQQQADDQNILPKVGIDDIPDTLHIPTASLQKIDTPSSSTYPLTYYTEGTNGLIYQQIVIELPQLDDDLLDLLSIYATCLTELGCKDKDYIQTQAFQASIVGSLTAFTSFRSDIHDEQTVKGHLTLSGKALVANQEPLTQLMYDTLAHVRFDEYDRIQELVTQICLRKEQSVTQNGHSLALIAATSKMSPVSQLSHRLSGLASIRQFKLLKNTLNDNNVVKHLSDQLRLLHQKIQKAPRQFLIISEEQYQQTVQHTLEDLWAKDSILVPDKQHQSLILPPIRDTVSQFWLSATQVNFCAQVYKAVPYGHPDAAALSVLGHYLKHHYLHRCIREQGGAYGCGASFDPTSASFRFHSYRDPRLTETLNDFKQSITWLTEKPQTSEFLEQAILSVISDIDKPSSPAAMAKQAFHSELYGRTTQRRQAFRAKLLTVTVEDMRTVCQRYLNPEAVSIAVLTNEHQLETAQLLNADIERLT